MAEETKKQKLPFLKKAERQACWAARDAYWECFRKNEEDKEKCAKQREAFETACPKMWVGHFDKKFYYEKFKSNMDATGWQKLDEDFEKRGKKE